MNNVSQDAVGYRFLSAAEPNQDQPFQVSPPEGPPDFEVQQPADAERSAIRYATKDELFTCRMDPSAEDNYQAFVEAIAYMKSNYSAKGIPSKLVLAPGTYKIKLGKAGGTHPERVIAIAGLVDFTLDGAGAVLEFSYAYGNAYKHSRNLWFDSCVRTKVVNLRIDWDWAEYPLNSLLEVVAIGPDWREITFKVHDFQESRRRQLEDLDLTSNDFLPYDPHRASIGVDWVHFLNVQGDATFRKNSVFDPQQTRWDGDCVTLVAKPEGSEILKNMVRDGCQYVVRHYVYETHGISLQSCTHFSLEQVTLYSAPGMGVILGGKQEYTRLRQVHIGKKPGTVGKRYSSAAADGVHVQHSRGHLIIEDSVIEDNQDDNINIHDNIHRGVRFSGGSNQLELLGYRLITPMTVGDPIELVMPDASPLQPRWMANILAFEGGVLTLDTRLPSGIAEVEQNRMLVLNRTYHSSHYVIRNNVFRGNKGRSIVAQCSDGLIENNLFFGQRKTAIALDTEISSSWKEGYGVHNVIVRNNTFENNNVETVWLPHRQSPVIRIGAFNGEQWKEQDELKWGLQRNIRIENNKFKAYPGVAMQLTGCEQVTIEGNVFQNYIRRPADGRTYNGSIYVYFGRKLNIVDNQWCSSPVLQHPGVFYHPTHVRREDIRFGGNRVFGEYGEAERYEFRTSLSGLTPNRDGVLRVVWVTGPDGGIYRLEESEGLLAPDQEPVVVNTYSERTGVLETSYRIKLPAVTEKDVTFRFVCLGKDDRSTGYQLLRYDRAVRNGKTDFTLVLKES